MNERWFATSRFELGARPEPDLSIDPAMYLIHAKELGTTRSACGQDTSAWMKHWASFQGVALEHACPRCLAIVGALTEVSA